MLIKTKSNREPSTSLYHQNNGGTAHLVAALKLITIIKIPVIKIVTDALMLPKSDYRLNRVIFRADAGQVEFDINCHHKFIQIQA